MGRSRDVLERQKQDIRLVLRSATLDDCVSYGPAEDKNGHDRSLILPGRQESLGVQRTPRGTAEFTEVVHRLVDDQHPHVRWCLPALLGALGRQDRELLRLRVSWGYSGKSVKRGLGLSPRFSVDQHIETLLGELACALWTDQGQAILPVPVAVGR